MSLPSHGLVRPQATGKSSTASCSALAGRGTSGKNPDMDWKWLDDFLVWRVTASPGVSTPYETGAGDTWTQRHQPHFSSWHIKIWRSFKEWLEWSTQRFYVGGIFGAPSPAFFHLRRDALRSCLTPMLFASTCQADRLLCNMENKAWTRASFSFRKPPYLGIPPGQKAEESMF